MTTKEQKKSNILLRVSCFEYLVFVEDVQRATVVGEPSGVATHPSLVFVLISADVSVL